MARPPRLRNYVGITGGALGLVGLIVTPASACLRHDDGGSPSVDFATESLTGPDPVKTILYRTTEQTEPQHVAARRVAAKRMAGERVVVLDSAALLQAKLDRIAARTAADTAQWDGVSSLSAGQWRAATADLHAAKRSGWLLATLDRADAGTAGQQSQIDALQQPVAALISHLRALVRSEFSDRDGFRTFHRSGSFDRHECDHDWNGYGDRSRERDRDSSRV